MHDLIRRAGAAHGIDAFALLRQPVSWDGVGNPFALLPHQPSADECSRLTLHGTGAQVSKSS